MLEPPAIEYVFAIAAVIAVGLGVAFRSSRNRGRPGANAFMLMMIGITLWSTAYALQLFATTDELYMLFLRLEYLFVPFVPVAWLVFVLEYTGRDRYVTRRTVAGLCLLPVAIVVAAWTNPHHQLLWTDRALAMAGGLGGSNLNAGFWLYTAYSYLLLAGGVWYLVELAIEDEGRYRRQATALVVAALVPWAAQVVHLMGPTWAPTVNLTPFSFVLSGTIMLGALDRFELLSADPVAARVADDRVVEELDDGVLVVDANGTVVDSNPAARSLLGRSGDSLDGEHVEECIPSLSDLESIAKFGAKTVTWTVDDDERHVEVSASTVETNHGKHSGWVVTLHDVTGRRRRQRRTELLNRVLRQTLQDEMDVSAGPASETAADGSDDIRERAMTALEVGDVTEEFDALLAESPSWEPADIVPLVQTEADTVRETFPGLSVKVDASLNEWAYCGGLFEPTFRALLRFAANRVVDQAVADDRPAEMSVSVTVADEDTVLVAVDGAAPTDRHYRILVDGVDGAESIDAGAPDELSCWLVHWGMERLGGEIAVADGTVSLRLPRLDDPDAA